MQSGLVSKRNRILVTGGAGFVGINLIRALHQRGYEVASFEMAPFTYSDMRSHIASVVGDIRDLRAVDGAMASIDIAIHAADALPRHSTKDILTTDIDGTRNVLDSALRQGVARVIHISTTAVYSIPDHCPLREDDTLREIGPYGKAKVAAQRLCHVYRERGLVVPILRPVAIIGLERLGIFERLFEWALDGHNFPMIGRGDNRRYQFVHVADLCDAIHACMTLPAAVVNDTFNIGAERYATMRADYQTVLDAAGFGKRIVPMPSAPMIWTLRLLNTLHLSPVYPWIYEFAGKDAYVSLDKAEALLGYRPRYSNGEALLSNVEWYRISRRQVAPQPAASHRVPWAKGALQLAKHFF